MWSGRLLSSPEARAEAEGKYLSQLEYFEQTLCQAGKVHGEARCCDELCLQLLQTSELQKFSQQEEKEKQSGRRKGEREKYIYIYIYIYTHIYICTRMYVCTYVQKCMARETLRLSVWGRETERESMSARETEREAERGERARARARARASVRDCERERDRERERQGETDLCSGQKRLYACNSECEREVT